MLKKLHKNIRIRIYNNFISKLASSTIFPFMAIYFSINFGEYIAGILVIIQVIIQFFVGLYGGYLADIIGRKTIMVYGEALKSIAFICMALFNSPFIDSPHITYLAMLFVSISAGLTTPASEAMLIDVSNSENRNFMYSVNYWSFNISMMLGMFLGGLLFEQHMFLLLLILVVLSVITLSMTCFLIKETYIPQHKIEKPSIKNMFHNYALVSRDFSFLLFTLGGIVILSLEFQLNNYISINLKNHFKDVSIAFSDTFMFHINGIQILSLISITNTILVIILSSIIANFIKQRNNEIILYIGFLLFGIGYSILLLTLNIWILLIAVLIFTIGELLFVPIRQTILADLINNDYRGSYMAFNGLVYQVGRMLGGAGIIVGGIIGNVSMSLVYISFSLIAIFFTKGAINLKRSEKNV